MLTVFRNGVAVAGPANEIQPGELVQGVDGQWREARAYSDLAPSVATQPSPSPGVPPWMKVALGVGAAWAAVALYKRVASDPEPRRIRAIAESYEREGAIVSADIRGWPQPPTLNGRRPDVFAEFADGWREAVEVENDRSVDRSHAREQIADLAEWEASTRRTLFLVDIVRGGRGGKS